MSESKSKKKFTYEWPRPMVTVDVALFSHIKNDWNVLLIARKNDPFQHFYALPGGFIDMDETLEESALRELKEETGIHGVNIEQFWSYGDPGRDPRGRCVTVLFIGRIDEEHAYDQTKAGDDAESAKWFPINKLPQLAFDHREILDHILSEFPFSTSVF